AVLNKPLPRGIHVQTLSVTEPFFTSLTIAAHAAVLVAFPVLVYNAYRYISPALVPEQRRAVRALLVGSPALFLTGIVFAYMVVLGPGVHFLLGIGQGSFQVAVRAQEYYSFV